jgi:hypothetical protein
MEIVAEEWRAVEGYVALEASSLGRVRTVPHLWHSKDGRRTFRNGKVLSQYKTPNGYMTVRVAVADGNRKTKKVHSLVARAFLGPQPRGLDVNHIDGHKTNNRIENLEYVTRSENLRHAVRPGLATPPWSDNRGERHGLAKLNANKVREIRALAKAGVGTGRLAGAFKVSSGTVYRVVTRSAWSHVA